MLYRLILAALVAAPLAASATALSLPGTPPDSVAVPGPPAATRPVSASNPLPWYRPSHVVLQTGGGLGMIAGGAGFSLKDRLDLDILIGYVPEKYAGSALSLVSAKLLYSPWTLPLRDKLTLKPLSVGGYFSYTHGTINDEEPDQYQPGYYWFSTDTRVGPLLGSRLSYALPATASGRSRSLSAYYEFGTNDLYIVSYVQNRRGLSPADILTLSLGLKLDI
ncbi:hypothetical protein [Hymenobacter metallilatus]|uniref:Outer membrane protein beta-barrel domain-containing protein n=1 Tax=Hymenobacter metallilatus TaxID=2493666 RepID=A0A428JTV4_9BACT|nr:hypothetical protein [Hymenobacter metallilatus]RSK37567.1 hypothetical protein EI290_02660 [Hymenobacter metallilatus]